MTEIDAKTQYDRLSQDWRQVHNIMWQIPSIAISIITGVIFAAYQMEGYFRLFALVIGSIFLYALTVEIIKKRLLMNAISYRLYRMESDSSLRPFPFETRQLINEVENMSDNTDKNDPVYRLFRYSYARQYLGHVVFAAAVFTSILAFSEFILYNTEWWAVPAAIAIVFILCAGITIGIIRNHLKK